jgi:hypothetical protein
LAGLEANLPLACDKDINPPERAASRAEPLEIDPQGNVMRSAWLAALLGWLAIPAMRKRAILLARHIDQLVEQEIAEHKSGEKHGGVYGKAPVGDRPQLVIVFAHRRAPDTAPPIIETMKSRRRIIDGRASRLCGYRAGPARLVRRPRTAPRDRRSAADRCAGD